MPADLPSRTYAQVAGWWHLDTPAGPACGLRGRADYHAHGRTPPAGRMCPHCEALR